MKKNLNSAIALALLTTFASFSATSLQPKPAHAVVGAIIGNVPTVVVGASLMGAGAVLITAAFTTSNPCPLLGTGGPGCFPWFASAFYGAVGSVIGLVVLDGETGEFGQLSPATVRAAGLTQVEHGAYAAELSEIVSVSQQIKSELNDEYQKTGEVSVEQAKSLWNQYGSELSPAAFSAVQKISVHAVNQTIANQDNK